MGFSKLFVMNESDAQKSCTTVLLDGGLGTTLEDVFHKDIKHPLWSARLVDEDEKSIVAAHLAFLRAGSQVILTSTYQASYETFRRSGYADSDGEQLMWKSVRLAADSCKDYELEATSRASSKSSSCPRHKVALSLGPYGATLETAAEFTGLYPPPYGPSLSSCATIRGPVPVSEEQSYEDALAAFHYSRLLVYAHKADIWNMIDIVAFETVPLVTEAKAIRRAVARLQAWFREMNAEENSPGQRTREMRPWYISFVFPGTHGTFPQYRCNDITQQGSEILIDPLKDWRPYTPDEVAHIALSPQKDDFPEMAIPDGIGINCTNVTDISRIVGEFTSTAKNLLLESRSYFRDDLPWLVLLPNGGLVYDSVEHAWNISPDSKEGSVTSPEEWAQSVHDMLVDDQQQRAGIFGGVLLGGCCKTGPREIWALKEALAMSTKNL